MDVFYCVADLQPFFHPIGRIPGHFHQYSVRRIQRAVLYQLLRRGHTLHGEPAAGIRLQRLRQSVGEKKVFHVHKDSAQLFPAPFRFVRYPRSRGGQNTVKVSPA